ncbi:uncharacterized protein LOC118765915 [Octopus sinensis]|uniref:Uncharacterized protein LOC118765915 n=1 Tax=Octopus sinensis TaxID=2607531 RepID=A0A7E6FA51_9MOLL|nr:uncharacterized protein LOC118765915 [Octopus sinensis]
MIKPTSTSLLILNQFLHVAFFMLCAASFSNALITFQSPDKDLCNILPNQTILEKNITIILAKNEKMITGSFQIDDPDHTTAEVYICQRENNSVPATSECLTMTPLKQVQIIKVNTTYMVTSELPKTWNCTNCVVQWILRQGKYSQMRSLFLFLFYCLRLSEGGSIVFSRVCLFVWTSYLLDRFG